MPGSNMAYDFDLSDILLYILAFILPPVPVLIRYGAFTNQFLLNILLTILFGVPGTVHAIYLIYKSSERINLSDETDYERIIEAGSNGSTFAQDINAGGNVNSADFPSDKGLGSSSKGAVHSNDPPPYEESQSPLQNSTDNKVQR